MRAQEWIDLREAVNDYLDADGSRGVYDAVKLVTARARLESLLAGPPPREAPSLGSNQDRDTSSIGRW